MWPLNINSFGLVNYWCGKELLFIMINSKISKNWLSVVAFHNFEIHTYTYNWSLQPSCQDYNLASDTNNVVWLLILYICVRTYRLKSNPNYRFFWEASHDSFIYSSEFMPEIWWKKVAEKKYFFFFFFANFVLLCDCCFYTSVAGPTD